MNFLKRAYIWLKRMSYRRGYGIHSPWAFNIVRGVIYEKGNYLAYQSLHEQRNTSRGEREDKLMLLLSNELQPKRGFYEGNDITLEYLKAGCKTCEYLSSPLTGITNESLDILYADTSDFENMAPYIVEKLSARALLIVRNIRKDDACLKTWRELISHPRIRVTFDLYEIGLAYTEERLNKQDYIINF